MNALRLARRATGRSGGGLLLLLLGAALTLGLGVLDATRWSQGPDLTVAPPVTVQALLEEGSQERHSVYAMLRTQAPGARLILDTAGPSPGTDSTYLRTLAGVGTIERRALPDGWVPDGEPSSQGAFRSSSWSLHREPGPMDTVLVGVRDGRTVLVDRRSVPTDVSVTLAIEPWTETVDAPIAPSFARAVTFETSVLVLLVLLGGLVLPRQLAPGAARPALALIAGVAVQALTSYSFLAGRAAMLLGPVLAVGIGIVLLRQGSAPGWSRADLPALGVTVAALTAVVAGVRHLGLVIVQADAIALIARAIGMGSGVLGLVDLDEKRPLSGSALHAPAHVLGVEGLHALGWALLLAAAVILVLLPRLLADPDTSGHDGGRDHSALARRGLLVAGFAALLTAALAINPLHAAITSLVSTNLMVAGMLLLLTVLWARDHQLAGRSDVSGRTGVAPVGVVTLLALIPTRAESILIVGLVLLATLAVRDRTMRWPWAWPAVGAGLAVWSGLHVVAAVSTGGRPSFPVTLSTVAGLLVLVAGPVLIRLPGSLRRGLPMVAMGLLWTFVLALALTPLGASSRIFLGLAVNIGQGDGAWGVLGPAIAVMAVLALGATIVLRDERLTLPFWIVLGAFPSVVIAKAADGTDRTLFDDPAAAIGSILSGGARIGSWGDSANRMWTHFTLVVLALLIMAIVVALQRTAQVGAERTPRATVRLATLVAVVGASIGVVLAAWQPAYLGPIAPGAVRVLEQRETATAGPELTGDTRIERIVQVPRVELPGDASDVAVCVEYRFADLGRVNWGTTRFGIDGPRGAVRDDFGEMAWSGERIRAVCLPDSALGREPVTVTAWLGGDARAVPGSSAAILTDAGGDPVASVELHYVAPSEDPRPVVMRTVSRLIRWSMQAGPAAIAFLLGAGLLLSVRRRVAAG